MADFAGVLPDAVSENSQFTPAPNVGAGRDRWVISVGRGE